MQFSKSTDTAPNHLYIDIHIKMKTGKSYPPKLQTYMVCYGIKGLQADVPSNVYDALWGVDNGVVTFNETINMGNNKITGVADGTADNDAVNKSQLDAYRGYYYFTNNLKHNNETIVKFPANFSRYPFSTTKHQSYQRLNIVLAGYYHIIYTDFYKGTGGTFKIYHDAYNGLNPPPDIYKIDIDGQTKYTPITINAVVKIDLVSSNFDGSDRSAKIVLEYETSNGNLDGVGYSSFYIRYLHP